VHCMGEDDDAMESTASGSAAGTVTEGLADGITSTPAPETPAAAPTEEKEGPAMAESTTPAAETAAVPAAGGVHLTDEQFQQLLARVTGPAPAAAPAAESAPVEPVAEAAPAAEVAETEDQRIARLVAEGVQAALPKAIQEHVETTGGPARKGLVPQVSETAGGAGTRADGLPEGWPQKPLHQYTDEEWRAHVAPSTVGAILGARGAAPAE